jgi:prophage tail gpP-like protein
LPAAQQLRNETIAGYRDDEVTGSTRSALWRLSDSESESKRITANVKMTRNPW